MGNVNHAPSETRTMSTDDPRRLSITIDPNRCVGSTLCIQYAPLVFTLNDQRHATVRDPCAETTAHIHEAAEQCPMSAIILTDADTGERVFP